MLVGVNNHDARMAGLVLTLSKYVPWPVVGIFQDSMYEWLRASLLSSTQVCDAKTRSRGRGAVTASGSSGAQRAAMPGSEHSKTLEANIYRNIG